MSNAILLVDDEPNVISALRRAFMEEPYDVETAESGEAGLAVMEKKAFKVVMSDERMPGMGGAEFLSRVKVLYPDCVRIMLTGHASIESTMKAVNSGEIYRFFTKPWNDIELRLAVRAAVEKFDLEAENKRLLATVKSQAKELRMLEKKFPGIAHVDRDEQGNLIVPEMSDDEMAEILAECERMFA